MIQILDKYKAIPIGFVCTFLISQYFQFAGFIKIGSDELLIAVLLFIFWALVISGIAHALLSHRKSKYFFLAIAGFLISILGIGLAKYLDKGILIGCFIIMLIALSLGSVFSWYLHTYKKETEKRIRTILLRLVGLGLLLIGIIIFDDYMNVPDNPGTFFLLMIFWSGIFSILFSKFFSKYKLLIAGVYALAFGYFSFVRLFSENFETYAANSKEGAMILMIIPIPIFGLIWIYEQWKWFKTLESEKSKAELSLLKSQVNPHFFFNTLNNLYGLTVEKSVQAPNVVLKLSDMMRYTIYEGEKDEVQIEDEIKYLENYIELHKIRYERNVDITFNQEIKNTCKIAPLMFIILLENAIKHGIENMTENAYIKIDLTTDETEVKFTIENNFEESEVQSSNGIGLQNLRKRLALIYPRTHELTSSSQNGLYKAQLKIELK